jgi:hypothetical protein
VAAVAGIEVCCECCCTGSSMYACMGVKVATCTCRTVRFFQRCFITCGIMGIFQAGAQVCARGPLLVWGASLSWTNRASQQSGGWAAHCCGGQCKAKLWQGINMVYCTVYGVHCALVQPTIKPGMLGYFVAFDGCCWLRSANRSCLVLTGFGPVLVRFWSGFWCASSGWRWVGGYGCCYRCRYKFL